MPTRSDQLKSIVQLLGTSVTKSEFQDAVATLVKFVKEIRTGNEEEWSLLKAAFSMLGDTLTKENAAKIDKEVSRVGKLLTAPIQKALKEQESGMKFIYDKVAKIKQGSDGEDGQDGKPGRMPTDQELLAIIRPLIPTVENGKDAEIDIDAIVAQVIPKIPARGPVGWGAHPLRILDSNGAAVEKVARHIKFGSNLTTSRSADGVVTVNATGGAGLSVLTANETPDDSTLIFTFASTPTLVVVNGTTYRHGHGCSIAATTVTLDAPVGTGNDIYALG